VDGSGISGGLHRERNGGRLRPPGLRCVVRPYDVRVRLEAGDGRLGLLQNGWVAKSIDRALGASARLPQGAVGALDYAGE
jgi:hypothetical protein